MTDQEKMLLEISIRLSALESLLFKNKIIVKDELLNEVNLLAEQLKEQLKS